MSGLGGQIQFFIRRGDEEVIALNGSSFAPALTDPAAVRAEMNPYRRATVPTWLKSLEFLWREYGSGKIAWRELIEPALGYRAYRVYSFPPPAGGWVMMQTLKLYEEQRREGWDIEAERQAMTRSIFLAQRDRRERPVEDFDDYGDFLERKLSEEYVAALLEQLHSTGNSGRESNGGETTHFSLIDADGFAISATTSINAYYGVRVAAPELGFLYNSYMDDFIFGDPAHPYAIAPGKPAYSSMSPSIVTRDGETVLVLGSPGSARIISAVAQVIAAFAENAESLDVLLAAPRIHVTGGGSLYLENPDWLPIIESVGIEYSLPSTDLMINGLNAYFGGVHAVGRLRGEWQAAADPRRDGAGLVLTP